MNSLIMLKTLRRRVAGVQGAGAKPPETAEASPSTATTVTTVAERPNPASPRKSTASARAGLVDSTGYVLASRPSAESTSTTRTLPSAVAETTLTTSVPVTLVTAKKPDDEK